jgi:uroporphyrinogen-III synthase
MTQVIAIRPEPGLSATLAAGHELGLKMVGAPLFEIRARAWQCPDPAAIDALLIGSANVFLHGGDQLSLLQQKPVHAVGQATADAARAAGFVVAKAGMGGLQSVLDTIAAPTRLLRIAGAEHVPLESRQGVMIDTVIAYENAPLSMPDQLAGLLRKGASQGPVVLLHSAAAAEHFASECNRLEVELGAIRLVALGPRIAAAAGSGWGAVHTASRPRESDLLEMVCNLCV